MGKGAPEEWKEWGRALVLFSPLLALESSRAKTVLSLGSGLRQQVHQQVSLLICFEGRSSCGRCLPDSPRDRTPGILARGPGEETESQRMFEEF